MHSAIRRTLAAAAVLLLPLTAVGCTEAADPNPAPAPGATQEAPDSQPFPPEQADLLSSALDDYAAGTDTEFSAAVYESSTGQAWHYNPDNSYLEASLVKVPILLTLLRQATDEQRELTPEEEELAVMMIEYSNNDSTTALYEAVGGAEELGRTYDLLGVTRTEATDIWGANDTGVEDQLRIARAVLDGVDWINGSLHGFAVELMENVDAGQSWGIGAGLPAFSAEIALKNGWLQDDDNVWNVGSMGFVRAGDNNDYAVVVLTSGTSTMEDGVAVVEEVAGVINAFESTGTTGTTGTADTEGPVWRVSGP